MVQMRAAAKFPAEAVADLHDTYGVAIFVAKESPHPRQFLRFGDRQLAPLHRQVLVDSLVDQALDLRLLRVGHWAGVREVERKLIRLDLRAALLDVLAKYPMERPV